VITALPHEVASSYSELEKKEMKQREEAMRLGFPCSSQFYPRSGGKKR
jgi:hypothetical protein